MVRKMFWLTTPWFSYVKTLYKKYTSLEYAKYTLDWPRSGYAVLYKVHSRHSDWVLQDAERDARQEEAQAGRSEH